MAAMRVCQRADKRVDKKAQGTDAAKAVLWVGMKVEMKVESKVALWVYP